MNSEIAEHKINSQKSIVFLHTNNKLPEKEINETISLIITPLPK